MREAEWLVLTFSIGLVVGNVLPPSAAVQAPGTGGSELVTGIGGVFFKADNPASFARKVSSRWAASTSTWYGRFAWIRDGEGNRVELWQPVSSSPEEFERRQRREEAR